MNEGRAGNLLLNDARSRDFDLHFCLPILGTLGFDFLHKVHASLGDLA